MSAKNHIAEFLRERAKRYREVASQEEDHDRAALLRELAETLEREAFAMEKTEQ